VRLELTRRGDYAVRTMLALAAGSAGSTDDAPRAWVSARRIAEQMAIPARFLPHVLRDLARAGLVEGRTGRAGGYRLARSPSAITLLEVVEAAEGTDGPAICVLRGGPCRPDGRCAVHDVFAGARANVRATLAATTLADTPLGPSSMANRGLARPHPPGPPGS
jgi:Rrf2 family protein